MPVFIHSIWEEGGIMSTSWVRTTQDKYFRIVDPGFPQFMFELELFPAPQWGKTPSTKAAPATAVSSLGSSTGLARRGQWQQHQPSWAQSQRSMCVCVNIFMFWIYSQMTQTHVAALPRSIENLDHTVCHEKKKSLPSNWFVSKTHCHLYENLLH